MQDMLLRLPAAGARTAGARCASRSADGVGRMAAAVRGDPWRLRHAAAKAFSGLPQGAPGGSLSLRSPLMHSFGDGAYQ